jgi:hypothetical protein
MKTIQNIFFCMGTIVVAGQRQHSKPLPQGVNERYGEVSTVTLSLFRSSFDDVQTVMVQ